MALLTAEVGDQIRREEGVGAASFAAHFLTFVSRSGLLLGLLRPNAFTKQKRATTSANSRLSLIAAIRFATRIVSSATPTASIKLWTRPRSSGGRCRPCVPVSEQADCAGGSGADSVDGEFGAHFASLFPSASHRRL